MINAMRVNVFGPLNVTRSFIPMMRAAKTGTLLFVGSVGVYYGAPGASCYSGSKGLIEGLVPNMAIEVAPFGIRTSILTFGHFRTGLMSPETIKFGASNRLPEYEEINNLIKLGLNAQNGTQPGDPKKACEIVVEAVRGEGRCVGKELPLRLPVGHDAFGYIRASCNERLAVCDEWEGITSNTNVE
jgi:NAD(P)-dependent dehydrogenase (short-subunit alcohol dehydrogenase family)